MAEVITEIEKTDADLNFTIDSVEIDGADIKINCWIWSHYIRYNCSLETAEYTLSGQQAITLSGNQIEADLDDIPINSKRRKVVIVWDAGGDLEALVEYTNLVVSLWFNDQPSQAGNGSQPETFTIPSIDFRPTDSIIPYRPYKDDKDFAVKFKNLQSYSGVKLHFIIEVDSVNTFDSGDLLTYSSLASQVDWTFDGGAFPGAGVDPVVDINNAEEITFSNAALTALASGDWYIRITRSLN